MLNKSLYIHIPFCRRRCPYCGFYSTVYNDRLASSYIGAICKQLDLIPGKFNTIYIGGGTPSILNVRLLDRLLASLEPRAESGAEFTVEVNPESAGDEKFALMLAGGVNRVSIGAQSFNDAKLKRLGRIHDSSRAKACVMSAHKTGFRNISLDLIFGVRSETLKSWQADLKAAADLPVKHISCYALDCKKLESPEDAPRFYELAMDYLPKKGFKQYEISNFAVDGYASRHNMNYWDNGPYIGLGPSAVSYIDGKREESASDVSSYIKHVRRNEPTAASSEKLDRLSAARETAAIKIRVIEGINFGWFKEKTGSDFLELEKKALPKMLEEDLVEYVTDKGARKGVRLTRSGILFCDIVSGAFL